MYSFFLLIQYKYYIPLIVKSHLKPCGSHTTLSEHICQWFRLNLSHVKTEDGDVDLENISGKHARTCDEEKELGYILKQIILTVLELFI